MYACACTHMHVQDFVLMAERGINSVRIPIGHWIVHPSPPYIYGRGLGYIDDAVRWSREYGQTVLLDLHGAVGSQNGKQTSGLEDWAWTSADFDVNATLEVLRSSAVTPQQTYTRARNTVHAHVHGTRNTYTHT